MTTTQIDWTQRLARYKGLIFDCDGTLTDSMPLHYEAWYETMLQHGIEFSESQFYDYAGKPTETIIRLLAEQQSVELNVDVAAREKELAFDRRVLRVELRPDIAAVVKQMKGCVEMSVASGGNRDGVRRQLQVIGMIDDFPVVITAEDTIKHKPHPDPFLAAARKMNVPADQCLVWEDSPLGINAAQAAGMSAVDVRGPIDEWIWYEV